VLGGRGGQRVGMTNQDGDIPQPANDEDYKTLFKKIFRFNGFTNLKIFEIPLKTFEIAL
jgi:hypothetical protein